MLTPDGMKPASVRVAGETIAAVEAYDAPAGGAPVEDLGDRVLLPGVVDAHVHVNEPGRTEWEGFETATRAAAAGGVTTIVDMPLNCLPVTTTREALEAKARAVADHAWVDYAFWGGVVPGNARELEPMLDAGVPGMKCFLVHSGIDEFPNVTEADLAEAMPILARRGAVLLVHAEMPGPIEAAAAGLAAAGSAADPRRYATWLASRPRASEDEAIALMLRLAARHRCRVHIVHLSSADALPLLAEARAAGAPVTVETCPHYLTFAAEEIPDGATPYKCAPPIRERENRERLWRALGEGAIDAVVSDHSPCTPALKSLDRGDYLAAWGGVASLQLALAATWTGARERGYGPADLATWMSARPAALAGLAHRKGAIRAGLDADLVVWDPDASWRVDPARLFHRHPVTPYAGRTLHGVVERTIVRGEVVYDRGQHRGPRGRRLECRTSST